MLIERTAIKRKLIRILHYHSETDRLTCIEAVSVRHTVGCDKKGNSCYEYRRTISSNTIDTLDDPCHDTQTQELTSQLHCPDSGSIKNEGTRTTAYYAHLPRDKVRSLMKEASA